MKRYLEAKEIEVLFFSAYFLYGRCKYGHTEHGDIRLGRIAACKGVMRLCEGWMKAPEARLRSRLSDAFVLLQRQADRLADGTFKHAYLETLEALREAHAKSG